jgi:hypothetical protein
MDPLIIKNIIIIGESVSLKNWVSELIHLSQNIYLYLIIIGGKDYMDNVEKGDIEIDSWCVVGIGGVTGSGV